MRILHLVPGLDDPTCGIAVAAKWIARKQRDGGDHVDVIDVRRADAQASARLAGYDEVWVHSMWTPRVLCACWNVLRSRRRAESRRDVSAANRFPALVRMPHGCLDPVKVKYHWHKKMLAAPFERWLFGKSDRVIVTEDDEAQWAAAWCDRTKIQMLDLGSAVAYAPRTGLGNRRFLFVGRMHPLKGLDALIGAVRRLKDGGMLPDDFRLSVVGRDEKAMRAEFEEAAVGLPVEFAGELPADAKLRKMAMSDCLVLPTLSENFALVVKESLELGVPVITTDGAKVWRGHAGVTYIDGYVAATHERRVSLLADAMSRVLGVTERSSPA